MHLLLCSESIKNWNKFMSSLTSNLIFINRLIASDRVKIDFFFPQRETFVCCRAEERGSILIYFKTALVKNETISSILTIKSITSWASCCITSDFYWFTVHLLS